MNSRISVVLLVAFAFLFCSCGDDDKSADADGPVSAEVRTPLPDVLADLPVRADTLADAEAIEELVEPPDTIDDEMKYTPLDCQGEVECKYNGKAERRCVEGPDGTWGWSKVMECPGGQLCVEGVGCTCDLGGCDGEEALGNCGGLELDSCQFWTCDDSCCKAASIAAPDCCLTGLDCRDCFFPEEDGERFPCPGEVPEGAVPDLCTQDFCLSHECSHADISCDDGSDMTIDSCAPATGDCSSTPDPLLIMLPCWGATEEDAHGPCFDNDLCTLDVCDFGDEFIPYTDPETPDFDPECTENHPDWPDCNPKPENVYYCKNVDKVEAGLCDDMDICTVDTCDEDVGCEHDFDFDSGDCWCDDDADCADGDLCTDEYCDLALQVCTYPQIDCNDGDYCTEDCCDPAVGCVYCGDLCPTLYCFTDDPSECDDDDECTDDFCDFKPGDEFGECKFFEKLCDDGDPETEEACMDGVCVVV